MDSKKRSLLAASVAGLVAAAGVMMTGSHVQAAENADNPHVPCYGINKCKGTGDCGGKGHTCAGQNTCAGSGFVKLEKDTCLKIKGGSLTPIAS